MKLCKNCKYCKPIEFFIAANKYEFATCSYSRTTNVNVVSGEILSFSRYCSTMRKFDCGQDAEFFEFKKHSDGYLNELQEYMTWAGFYSILGFAFIILICVVTDEVVTR